MITVNSRMAPSLYKLNKNNSIATLTIETEESTYDMNMREIKELRDELNVIIEWVEGEEQ